MMKRLLAALLVMVPNVAWATCSSVPYTFTPNTLAQSGQVNANFAAVVNCANNIDTSQITTGTLSVARGGTNNTSWTTGSIVFATASTQLGQDNANLFWDATNLRLMIGDNSAVGAVNPALHVTITSGGSTAIAAAYSSSQASFALNPASDGSWAMFDHVGGSFTRSIISSGGNIGIGVAPTVPLDVNGSILSRNNGVISQGSNSGLVASDRSTSGVFELYRTGGINRLFDSTFGDTITFDGGGHVAIDTTVNTSFALTTTGAINTASYYVNGSLVVGGGGAYNQFYDRSGNASFISGGSGDPTNYYRNTNHDWGSIAGGSTYMFLDSGGNLSLAGNYLSFTSNSRNCTVNSSGGPCIYGDSANIVIKSAGTGTNGTLIQNASGTDVAVFLGNGNAAINGALSAGGAITGGSGSSFTTATIGGITMSSGNLSTSGALTGGSVNSTGNMTIPNGNDYVITSAGSVQYSGGKFGIVNSNSGSFMTADDDGSVVGADNTTGQFCLYNTGSAWVCTSDARVKKNITPLTTTASSFTAALGQLHPITYQLLKTDVSPQTGFTAQDVQAVFPDLVQNMGRPTDTTPDGTLGLNYAGLVVPMVAAIKELDARITALEKK